MIDLLEFAKIAAPVASGTFALTRLWDRWHHRRLAVRAGLHNGIDPTSKQVVVKSVLTWDVLGEQGLVEQIAFELVPPGHRFGKLRAKLLRREPPTVTRLFPPRLEGPQFPHSLTGRGTWFVPPEDVIPYARAADMDRKFKLHPIAVVRRGTKVRTIVGKDVRPALTKAHIAA